MEKPLQYALGFDKMISPIIIKIIYFLLLAGVLIGAILALFRGEFIAAIFGLVFGALGVRIWCELLILMFRIHDNLVEINQSLKKNNQP